MLKYAIPVLFASMLHALPQGAEVQSGTMQIEAQGAAMAVALGSDKTVVNWDSFSIGHRESVHISMPNANSSMLNRVVGGNLSEIHGKLSSNGQVWLINPAGILIGETGVIETASFLAATFDVLKSPVGTITHLGTIRCPNGNVQLIAKEIVVDGGIEGKRVDVGFYYSPSREVQIEANPELELDHPYAHAICVNGVIKAPEGEVTIRGHEIFLNQDSLIDVSSIEANDAGKAIIFGEKFTGFAGMILATGGPNGGDGGFVEVSGAVLDFRGFADRRAPKGHAGMLLLDPYNIEITNTNSNTSFNGGTRTYTASADNGTIDAASIVTNLTGGNVTVSTMGAGTQVGSITVTNAISSVATTRLIFSSSGPIIINAGISVTGTAGQDTIDFTAAGTGTGSNYAGITVSAAVSSANGRIKMVGTGAGTGTDEHGINIASGGSLATTNTGSITLTGTAPAASTGTSRGVYISGGTITTNSGAISVTGTVTSGATGTSEGILMALMNGITSTTGTMTFSGTSSASGTGSHGVSITADWTTGTNGLVTFTSCTGGSGATSNGLNVGAAFLTTGSITGITTIRGGTGSGSIGCLVTGAMSKISSSSAGAVNITASSLASAGSPHGISIDTSGGLISTTGAGTIRLIGTGGAATGGGGTRAGVNLVAGSTVSSASGTISVAGRGTSGTNSVTLGVLLASTTSIVTTGNINVSGTSIDGATGNSHGVSITDNWEPTSTGTVTFGSSITDGTVTIQGCRGGGGSSNGLSVTAAFSTLGNITAINQIQSGNAGSAACAVTGASSKIASTGAGTINITGTGRGLSGNSYGIRIETSGAVISTTGAGTIRLIGVSSSTNSIGDGISIVAGASVLSGSGTISLAGRSVASSGWGVRLASTTSIMTTGDINISGTATGTTSTATGGVLISAAWVCNSAGTITFGPSITDGTVTIEGCVGSSGTSSPGLSVTAGFTTEKHITAINMVRGGTGGTGVGCLVSGGTASISSTNGGNINITASSQSTTTGAAHGIAIDTSGGRITTTGSGSIRLIGTGGTTTGGSRGVSTVAGAIISSGSGTISVAGVASGTTAAAVGVLLASTTSITTTGDINVSGTSTCTVANSHGVSITGAWTTTSTGTVTFGPVITDGTVSVQGCIGGTGATSHGINNSAAFSTGGAIVATNQIQGRATSSGAIGFNQGAAFGSSGGGAITITATSNGSGTGCHGINIGSGALSSSAAITLNGTSSASSTGTSRGINISGGTISGSAGTTSLTGTVPAGATGTSEGINMAQANGITATGPISLDGTSNASGASSHGVLIAANWTTGTSGLLSITGATTGGSGSFPIAISGTNPALTTSGAAIFNSNVGLIGTGTTTITTTGNLTFSGTIDGLTAATQALTLAGATGTAILSGNVGTTTSLAAISITKGAASIGANITSSSLSVTPAATITGPSTITTTGTILFSNTITGAQPLTLIATSSSITLTGAVGTLSSFSSSSNALTSAAITTTGNLSLTANSLSLSGNLTGGGVLTVQPLGVSTTVGIGDNTTGKTLIIPVALFQPGFTSIILGSSTGTGAVEVKDMGTLTFADPLTIRSATGTITVSSPVTVSEAGGALTIITGSPGEIQLSVTMTTNSGDQTYNGPVTLSGNTVITNGGGTGAVGFTNTINGANTLSVTAGTGTVTFGGIVGGGTPPTQLTVGTSGTTAVNANLIVAGPLSLTAATAIALSGTRTLTTTGGGSMAFTGPMTLGGATTFTNSGTAGDINIGGTVNGAQNLSITGGTGTVTFGGIVGGGTPPTQLTVGTSGTTAVNANLTVAGPLSLTAATAIALSGTRTLTTTGGGSMAFTGLMTIGGATTFTNSGTAGDINIGGTVNGAQSLSITGGTGTVTFGGIVGGGTPPTQLTVGTSGTTAVNANLIVAGPLSLTAATAIALSGARTLTTTGGGSMAFTGPMTLGGATTFTNSGTAGDINIGGTVNGAQSLSITGGTGTVTFGGIVGGGTPPTQLTVGTSGTTAVNANLTVAGPLSLTAATAIALSGTRTLTTTGGGSMAFTGPMTIGGATTFTNSGTAGDINIGGMVNGAQSLSITGGTGTVTFSGIVGGGTPPTQLTVGTSGTTAVNANLIVAGPLSLTATTAIALSGTRTLTTTGGGSMAFTGPMTLGGATTFTNSGTAGDINIGGMVNGAQSLSITGGTGTVTFGGIVGEDTPPTQLTVGTSGTTAVNANLIVAGPLSLTATTVIALSGARTLTTTDGGSMAFTGPMTIGGATTFTNSGTAGDITISGTVSGAHSLHITDGTGDVALNGAVSIRELTVVSSGSFENGANVTTIEAIAITSDDVNLRADWDGSEITYTGPVTLLSNVSASADDNILFTETIDGGFDLGLASAGGTVTITGVVGATPLDAFTITSGTSAAFNSITCATLGVTPPVALNGNAILTTSGALTLENQVTGPYSLEIANTGLATLGGDIEITGPFDQSGMGNVSVGTIEVATVNTNITFDGQLLGANLTLDSGAGDVELHLVDSLLSLTASAHEIHLFDDVTATGSTLLFNDPVILETNLTIEDTGSGMTFQSTIDGPTFTLELLALNGQITVQGAVEVVTLTAHSGETSTFNGPITSGPVSISSDHASVEVAAINSTGAIELRPTYETTPNLLNPGDLMPNGIIVLSGDLTATGNITLRPVTMDRSEIISVATIAAEQDLVLSGNEITFGAYESLTVFGSVTFNSVGTATVGDVVALDNSTFNTGGTLFVYQNAPGLIYDSFGQLYIDGNTNIITTGVVSPNPLIYTLIPLAGAVDSPDVGTLNDYTRDQLESILRYAGYVLTLDAATIPPPPPPPAPPSGGGREAAIFNSLIAVDEMLEYRLPIWSYWKAYITRFLTDPLIDQNQ